MDETPRSDLSRIVDLHDGRFFRRVPGALELILVAKNLERIADHATNVAEDVIYMVAGRDVRHPAVDRNTA